MTTKIKRKRHVGSCLSWGVLSKEEVEDQMADIPQNLIPDSLVDTDWLSDHDD